MTALRGLATLVLAALASGCRPETPPQDPGAAVRQYASALESGDAERAYALLSSEARRSLSLEAFQAMLAENPGAVRDLADALQAESVQESVVATLSTPDGERLELVWEDGRWLAQAGAIDLYGQGTPESAIRTLIRAFEAGRFDVLVRLAPQNERKELTAAELQAAWDGELKAEMQSLVADLKATLPFAEVEVLGQRATVRYGAGAQLLMLREDGLWKIEEIEGGAQSDNSSQDE